MRERRITERQEATPGAVGDVAPGRTARTGGLSVQRKPSSTQPPTLMSAPATVRQHDDPFGMHLLRDGTRVADGGGDESKAAAEVERELEALIERGEWQKLRPQAFAEASVATDAHAKQRRDGEAPDLTGLGKVSTLDRFAHEMKVIQRIWGRLTVEGRTDAVKVALDHELVAADIPPLEGITAIARKPHPASFDFRTWHLNLRREFLEGESISDEDAADLTGTLAHEIRHGEQQFLTARLLAARGQDASQIVATLDGLHKPIAARAVAMKLKGLNRAERAYARRMHTALVTDRVTNNMFDADTGYAGLEAARAAGVDVLERLKKRPPTASLDEAREACRQLREHIDDVLLKYKIYRQLPTERDSHDVGAGAKLAFQEIE